MSQTTILGGVLLLLTVAYHVASRKKNVLGKPPVVPYLFPWIGSMISIGKDPDGFFRDISKVGKDGIVGVVAGGTTKYYITDASLIREVYKNSKAFAFVPIRLEYSVTIFGLSKQVTYAPYMKDEMFPFHHRLLSPTAIGALVSSYRSHAIRILSQFTPPKPSEPTSLIKLLHPQMYDSAILAFMGDSYPTHASYPLFLKFDDAFPLLAAGFMPNFVTAPGRKVREQLADVTERWIEERWNANNGGMDETSSELVKWLILESRQEGYSTRDIALLVNSDVWALQANSTWACFWVVALMLQQPEGLAPLYQELDDAVKTFRKSDTEPPGPKSISNFLASASLPLLASVISETLRYTTSSSSIRRVVEADGATLAGYTFEKDDELVCVTRTLHHSAEMYDDPMTFKPTRFVGEAKDKTGKFWNPFGGGVSMCEGRHFAQQEIFIFVACFLLYFDVSLDPAWTSSKANSDLELDMSRVGLGVLHPKGDLKVLVKKREVLL